MNESPQQIGSNKVTWNEKYVTIEHDNCWSSEKDEIVLSRTEVNNLAQLLCELDTKESPQEIGLNTVTWNETYVTINCDDNLSLSGHIHEITLSKTTDVKKLIKLLCEILFVDMELASKRIIKLEKKLDDSDKFSDMLERKRELEE